MKSYLVDSLAMSVVCYFKGRPAYLKPPSFLPPFNNRKKGTRGLLSFFWGGAGGGGGGNGRLNPHQS